MNKNRIKAVFWSGRLGAIAAGLDDYPRKFIDRLMEDVLDDSHDGDGTDTQLNLDAHGYDND